ncbi:hypothetical protein [Microtetraspora malaysiensis]|uniref:hypothetical protein n=1 Tax=Microtetraspora malaysiensis TaxID=161358 RepID=UPI003D8DC9B7
MGPSPYTVTRRSRRVAQAASGSGAADSSQDRTAGGVGASGRTRTSRSFSCSRSRTFVPKRYTPNSRLTAISGKFDRLRSWW